MKKGSKCMQECMHELKYKGTKERSQEQRVAICLKHCGQSKYDYQNHMSVNIDTIERKEFYCNLCKDTHYNDSMIGQHHKELMKRDII